MTTPAPVILTFVLTLVIAAGACASAPDPTTPPPPTNTPVPARAEPCPIEGWLQVQLLGRQVDSVVCFSWTENGEEKEFTAPGSSAIRTPDRKAGSVPAIGQTMSVWNGDTKVVSGTVESVATAYVEQDLPSRWETHVRLKVSK